MKFKIGDKVKTARKCGSGGGWRYNGEMPLDIIGEVVRIDDPESYIAVDIGSRGVNAYHPDELDIVPDETKTSEVVLFLKSIEEVQSFVKEKADWIAKTTENILSHGTSIERSQELISRLQDRCEVLESNLSTQQFNIGLLEKDRVKPTTSIFDSLNSPEEAVAFLVSEWVKCTNPKVKTELSQFNTMQNPNVSGIEFRFPKR